MKRIMSLCIVILLSLPLSGSAVTLRPFSDYVQSLAIQGSTLWVGTEDGLASMNTTDESFEVNRLEDGQGTTGIRSLFVDSQDIVWAGTTYGIASYDGVEWTFHHPGFETEDVWSIAEDMSGVLWFATSEGIVSYDRTTWTCIPEHFGGFEHLVFSVAVDKDDVKWFATNTSGVLRFDGVSWTRITTADGLANDQVSCIAVDQDNVKWFGCREYIGYPNFYIGGLSRFDGVSWKTYTVEDGLSYDGVLSLAVGSDNVLWIGTWNGLTRFDGSSWARFTEEDGQLPCQAVQAIAEGEDATIWIGTQQGLARYDGAFHDVSLYVEWMDLVTPYQLVVDLDNVKWFGSKVGGIASYDGNKWRNYTEELGLTYTRVNSIAVGPDNVKWFATGDKGLLRYDNHTWVAYTTENSDLPRNSVTAVEVDKDNVVWITIYEGVMSFDGVNWTLYPIEAEESSINDLIAVGPDNVKWFGAREGLVRFDGTNWEYIHKGDLGFPGDYVNFLSMDHEGILWAGYYVNPALNPDWEEGDDENDRYDWDNYDVSQNGVCWFDGSSFHAYRQSDGLVHWRIWDAAKDNSGTVWFTSGQGISRFDGIEWKSYTGELRSLGVGVTFYSVAVDQDNAVWFSGASVLVFENGAFKTTSGLVSSVKEGQSEPSATLIITNRPNPFNPSTTLAFTLPEAARATLDVYAVNGQKVRELHDGFLSAGNHALVWNGRDGSGGLASSGVYFVVLRAGSHITTRKMLLLR